MRIKRPNQPASNVRKITAGKNITARAGKKRPAQRVTAASEIMAKLTPEQRRFTKQIQRNMRNVTAATNTSNIAARPDFIELLPLFTQQLLTPEIAGTVAMNSRQQLIPYFKVKAENAKGDTARGQVLSTPFMNRNGVDPNFTGRVVRNEAVEASTLVYAPVLPYSVTVTDGTDTWNDDGAGNLVDAGGANAGTIDYASGIIGGVTGDLTASYQYDNETIGPDDNGKYGAKMGKIDLELDEINLIAQAHELACYYSVYAAFAAQQEYGSNIADLAKDSAFAEMTAEINSQTFAVLEDAASHKPQFDWDASPVLSGAVVPSDYLNMFKLKLNQASASVYQATRLARPNKIVCGTTAESYMSMIDGYQAADVSDTVGPYRAGKLDGFDIFVDPNYDPNKWVMCCKGSDLRRSSIIYGEYMPMMATDPITMATLDSQQGYCTMYDMQVVNPSTIVSGSILGTF